MILQLIDICYLVAVVLFILGIKLMSHPESARKGNSIALAGMILAIIASFFTPGLDNIALILIAIALGTVGGLYSAKTVQMTAMPQLVSFFNGMGGAAAALIGMVEYGDLPVDDTGKGAVLMASLIIGSVSFSGSMIAMGKLQGIIKDIRVNKILAFIVLGFSIALAVYVLNSGEPQPMLVYGLVFLALIYGLLFVYPIGGADMPVVISLLNSLTGVTAATTGLLYDNKVMLMGGILVGSAGLLLTLLMAKAMNRSVSNILFTSFGSASGASTSGEDGDQVAKEINTYDSAILLAYAKRVVVVPGYGLAVAQAQHAVHDLEKILEEKGVEVTYGIHPVAGRMPGHMNVLLAESDVSYDKLIEMDEMNEQLPNTDVVMVIGANDVVNPAANDDPSSPIYGMPILEVNRATNVIVIKRSMSSGYAGIQNALFFDPKTRMLFGDAKKVLNGLVSEVKNM
ncbi:NAD(P)(+) transhydrogenase (Re/Si-specific) subunit beta [Cyclobacterium jeungdonense]|uniref:NAD(P) transhydrogenase subunit beta n=1 Tax=Cyclobacterium jeungdonense TaxID=708087 RepID=A0ABT8CD40_9BACT|nr:NAD(P)(+) transhydrogenase (Re/Si-specific) subunit beta [Cyclobacterium jeungdonense]MDN3690317.1 NAD(P)(+) transhydrogenase (Re/Si-specific) subunit beta [Cyclobacterium jeungdonense]